MSDSKKCNGWSNRATWNCNLWFDDFTDQAIECIKDNWDKEDPDNLESATSILTDMIEETVTEYAIEAFLRRADWGMIYFVDKNNAKGYY